MHCDWVGFSETLEGEDLSYMIKDSLLIGLIGVCLALSNFEILPLAFKLGGVLLEEEF